jgi:hypothetical protein
MSATFAASNAGAVAADGKVFISDIGDLSTLLKVTVYAKYGSGSR